MQNSSVGPILDKASIEVSSALVFEVLKRLNNSSVLSLSFFRWAEKQSGFKYTTDSYNLLVESLGKAKQFRLIWVTVFDMKEKGVLTKDTFSLIARRYARARKADGVIDTFVKMEKYGFEMELSDFNRLMYVLIKANQVTKAQEVFDQMRNRRIVPNTKSYTILLEGWRHEKNLLKLDEGYREMKVEGFEPDAWNEKRLQEAVRFFELSKASGFPPEAPTYNALVGDFCSSGRFHDVDRILDEMRKCGEMSSDEVCEPTLSTYEVVMRMFCNEERVDMAIKIWDEMKEKGVLPGMHMFSMLINSLCHEDKVDEACKYFQEMLNLGIRPREASFRILKRSLLYKGRKDTVVHLDRQIEKLRKGRTSSMRQ
ncbi:hypothetical protein Tsubulata_024236 [Turnera subulata]|uniref:Pentacotripeptide-repeat region of PRORP domain-containing protein n=1 Tax=Turnera subulata TaxID=218843 RepID=A0A9Q0FFE3_9ROSI|nr:hypothetical protein Tsubulata_024236 [Turnera subulata]